MDTELREGDQSNSLVTDESVDNKSWFCWGANSAKSPLLKLICKYMAENTVGLYSITSDLHRHSWATTGFLLKGGSLKIWQREQAGESLKNKKKKLYRAAKFFISEVRRGQKTILAEALPHGHIKSGENVSLYPSPNKKEFLH